MFILLLKYNIYKLYLCIISVSVSCCVCSSVDMALLPSVGMLKLTSKSFYVITGPNGSGKTTFVKNKKFLLGDGRTSLNSMAYFHENQVSLRSSRRMPADTLISYYLACMRIIFAQNSPFVYDWENWSGTKSVRNFSDGESKYFKLMMWFCFNVHNDILILDEPFNCLDMDRVIDLIDFLKILSIAHHKTIILITHGENETLNRVKTHTVFMENYHISCVVENENHYDGDYFCSPIYMTNRQPLGEADRFAKMYMPYAAQLFDPIKVFAFLVYLATNIAIMYWTFHLVPEKEDNLEVRAPLNKFEFREILFALVYLYFIRLLTMSVLLMKVIDCLIWEYNNNVYSRWMYYAFIFSIYFALCMFETTTYIFVAKINHTDPIIYNVLAFFGIAQFIVGLVHVYQICLISKESLKYLYIFCLLTTMSIGCIGELSNVCISLIGIINIAALFADIETFLQLHMIGNHRNTITIVLCIWFVLCTCLTVKLRK